MKKIVLSKDANRVLWLAFRNKSFMRTFLTNPKKASIAARVNLTRGDVQLIRSFLTKNISVKVKELIALINAIHNGGGISSLAAAAKLPPKPPPPPPPWRLIIKIRSRGFS